MLNVVVLSADILSVIGPLVNIFLLIQIRYTSFGRKAIVRPTFFLTPYFVDTALLSLIRLFYGTTALSITTISIKTLTISGYFGTLSLTTVYYYAECCYMMSLEFYSLLC